MIGHYLLALTPEEEDRVLTTVMRPGEYVVCARLGPCLVGVVMGGEDSYREYLQNRRTDFDPRAVWDSMTKIEERYDSICRRFGTERINAAIRNRILTNKARRELAGQIAERAAR